jgi:hypothetical protein
MKLRKSLNQVGTLPNLFLISLHFFFSNMHFSALQLLPSVFVVLFLLSQRTSFSFVFSWFKLSLSCLASHCGLYFYTVFFLLLHIYSYHLNYLIAQSWTSHFLAQKQPVFNGPKRKPKVKVFYGLDPVNFTKYYFLLHFFVSLFHTDINNLLYLSGESCPFISHSIYLLVLQAYLFV